MTLGSLLSVDQIIPEMKATERWAAIVELIDLLVQKNRVRTSDRDSILAALRQREETMSTGIGFGIAIPHASSNCVSEVVAAFGRSSTGIEFDSLDNSPVRFIVLFVVPKDQFQVHLRTLAAIAKFLNDKSVREQLAKAESAEEILGIFDNKATRPRPPDARFRAWTTVSEMLRERLQNALQTIGIAIDEPLQMAPTTDPRHGDYQTNAAMVLGKKLKQNPRNLAGLIVANLSVNDIGTPPEVAGPGFINFRLSPEFLAHRLLELALDQRLGVERTGKPKTIVIDFSSPNIAKPMHVGHIRSTILGDALAKVARFLGHNVITDNHIGDWGTQFGKVIYGWKHLLIPGNLDSDPVAELVRIYREADTAAKNDSGILEECRRELVKLQQGDDENRRIWQRCVDFSIEEFSKVYDLLGVRFDCQLGESFYNPELPRVVQELLERGLAEVSDGAVVVWDRGA